MSLRWVWHLYNLPCVVIQEYSLALKVFNKNCENDFFLVQALCDTSVICSDQANSFLTSVNCVSNNRHQLSRTTSLIPSWGNSSSVVVRKLVICRNQNLIKISVPIKKNVWLKKSKSKEKIQITKGVQFFRCLLVQYDHIRSLLQGHCRHWCCWLESPPTASGLTWAISLELQGN